MQQITPSLSIYEKKAFTDQRRKEIKSSVSEEDRIISCNPLRAVRRKCMECSGSYENLSRCGCCTCPLWDFRFGTNPYKEEE